MYEKYLKEVFSLLMSEPKFALKMANVNMKKLANEVRLGCSLSMQCYPCYCTVSNIIFYPHFLLQILPSSACVIAISH